MLNLARRFLLTAQTASSARAACSANSIYCCHQRRFLSSKSSNGEDDSKSTDSLKGDNNKNPSKAEDGGNKEEKAVKSTSSEKDAVEEKSAKDKDSKYVIIGPDGVPYDPSKDPEYNDDYYSYKYPQYFTKHLGFQRAKNIVKEDLSLLRKGRIHKTREEIGCPNHVDVAIFGGGIIGTSIAYFLRDKAPFSMNIAVFERDPTYTRASTTLSAGGIRQQWQHPENIMMSMFTADFLRNSKRHLAILDKGEPPDVSFTPQGYLTLADETQAAQLIESHKLQIEMGALVELYTAERIKEKFPHVNTDGVVVGSYGVQNEGWFDPWALLLGLKAKAQCLGAEFVHADIIDFNTRKMHGHWDPATDEQQETANYVIVREPDGNVKHVEFGLGVIACGANSGSIARLLGYGKRRGIRSIEFPVEPRKRYVYVFNCRDGPGLDFPFLIDKTGAYCRREGLGGNFICGRSPSPEEEPDVDNLDVDYSYFDNEVHPLLAARVPAFEAIKLKGGWAGFYDYNKLDQHPIIGQDPYYSNLFWATGFSGHGLQMGPAIGRAIMETIIYDEYKTIDLSRYGWQRLLQNKPLELDNCV